MCCPEFSEELVLRSCAECCESLIVLPKSILMPLHSNVRMRVVCITGTVDNIFTNSAKVGKWLARCLHLFVITSSTEFYNFQNVQFSTRSWQRNTRFAWHDSSLEIFTLLKIFDMKKEDSLISSASSWMRFVNLWRIFLLLQKSSGAFFHFALCPRCHGSRMQSTAKKMKQSFRISTTK